MPEIWAITVNSILPASKHRSQTLNHSNHLWSSNFSLREQPSWPVWSRLHSGCGWCIASILPSYSALNPWALTAKSVVNQRVRMEPLLTIEEGSWNPDNLNFKQMWIQLKSMNLLLKLIWCSHSILLSTVAYLFDVSHWTIIWSVHQVLPVHWNEVHPSTRTCILKQFLKRSFPAENVQYNCLNIMHGT